MISLGRDEIEGLIDMAAAADAIEDAYRAASLGRINLPPVGYIVFPELSADCHIKYGHIQGEPTFVVKIATGFPQNPDLGLPSGNGVILVLSATNGRVEAVLHDEMMLTDIRTGLGGAITSRLLARADSKRVLIVGTGPQSQRQVEAHAALLPGAVSFEIWGRNPSKAKALVASLSGSWDISPASDLEQAVGRADIVVTATGSRAPLIKSEWVASGTHITAVGADAPGKQELDPTLVARAEVVAVDQIAQCVDHGEVSHAVGEGTIVVESLNEIGAVLTDASLGRTAPDQITVSDLTGIAAQDIAMANTVLSEFRKRHR